MKKSDQVKGQLRPAVGLTRHRMVPNLKVSGIPSLCMIDSEDASQPSLRHHPVTPRVEGVNCCGQAAAGRINHKTFRRLFKQQCWQCRIQSCYSRQWRLCSHYARSKLAEVSRKVSLHSWFLGYDSWTGPCQTRPAFAAALLIACAQARAQLPELLAASAPAAADLSAGIYPFLDASPEYSLFNQVAKQLSQSTSYSYLTDSWNKVSPSATFRAS